jgi:hypothetical protein
MGKQQEGVHTFWTPSFFYAIDFYPSLRGGTTKQSYQKSFRLESNRDCFVPRYDGFSV